MDILVVAAADGEVVYIRIGSSQDSEYGSNLGSPYRNCADAWGIHMVIKHTSGSAAV